MEVTEFQLSYTKSLKMMGLMCCTQYVSKFGKLSSGHRTGKDVLIPISVKGNAPKCLNYCTVGLITHASKFMLKILQARFQQYMNQEIPDGQTGFRKGRGLKFKLPTSIGSLKSERILGKYLLLLPGLH